jgi:hypothetical protein
MNDCFWRFFATLRFAQNDNKLDSVLALNGKCGIYSIRCQISPLRNASHCFGRNDSGEYAQISE